MHNSCIQAHNTGDSNFMVVLTIALCNCK